MRIYLNKNLCSVSKSIIIYDLLSIYFQYFCIYYLLLSKLHCKSIKYFTLVYLYGILKLNEIRNCSGEFKRPKCKSKQQ